MSNKEKVKRVTITAHPSMIEKALVISKGTLGRENLSGIIAYLVNREYEKRFPEPDVRAVVKNT